MKPCKKHSMNRKINFFIFGFYFKSTQKYLVKENIAQNDVSAN